MALALTSRVIGPLGTNVYIVYDDETKQALVVDPAYHGKSINKQLEELGLHLEAILLTHGHFDHISGTLELKELTGAPIYAAEAEREFLLDPAMNMTVKACIHPISLTADYYLKDGEILHLLGHEIKAILTPGHTGGSMSFYLEEMGILISGDTLFYGSVGRTDFPTGSMSAIVRSIQDKLLPLPDETIVCPGHGERTTIGYERKYNNFL